MAYQAIFQRYEMKYMLTRRQKDALLKVMAPYMALDRYGRTTICNLYYDTDSYRLIRRSLEKPAYKEKLRVRSYGTATETSPVFVELKKKYQDVVYKRRVSLPQDEAAAWMRGGEVKSRTRSRRRSTTCAGTMRTSSPSSFSAMSARRSSCATGATFA